MNNVIFSLYIESLQIASAYSDLCFYLMGKYFEPNAEYIIRRNHTFAGGT